MFTHLGDGSSRSREELRSDSWSHERIAGGVFHHPLMMHVMHAHSLRFVFCIAILQSSVPRGRLAQDLSGAWHTNSRARAHGRAHHVAVLLLFVLPVFHYNIAEAGLLSIANLGRDYTARKEGSGVTSPFGVRVPWIPPSHTQVILADLETYT